MIIALDIGNSRIKVGIRSNDSFDHFSADTHPIRDVRSYLEGLPIQGDAEGAIVSSVVNELDRSFAEYFRYTYNVSPVFLDHTINAGLTYSVRSPETIGPDRIANAAGAYSVCNGPAIVVDLGTATTITVVGKNREFLGGTIMPGVHTMARSLKEKTSKLPEVSVLRPASVIGKNTEENIRSGIIYGTAGAVGRMVDEIRAEIGYTISVVLTGGMCELFRELIHNADVVDPLLTMRGLILIFERQQQ